MRIGILTLPLHTNYGGILQAYALQTILERMGHEVLIIEKKRYFPILSEWKKPLVYTYRFLKKYLVDPTTIVRKEVITKEEYPIISQYTQQFIKQYIHTFQVDYVECIDSTYFDAIVVGSDQIWRPQYFKYTVSPNLSNAFLHFTKGWNIKRIAYAASFGVDIWEFPSEWDSEFETCAQMFNGISVREKSGVFLCKEHLNVDATHVLDPTMLLTLDDYRQLIDVVQQPHSRGNLLCYILDPNEKTNIIINQISHEKRLKPFYITAERKDRTLNLEQRVSEPVEAWIKGFIDAEFVITDSFHACIFSILFKKPFVAIGNTTRGMSRFSSLLATFDLCRNLLTDISEYDPEYEYSICSDIDSKLNIMRQHSFDFLTSCIGK